MNHFALFANLQQRPVLLVGAGHVAERKAQALLRAGALVRVVAMQLSETFQTWVAQGQVEYVAKRFNPELLKSVFLVVAATDDQDLNRQVYEAAQEQAKLCNVVDNPALCSYIVPAIIDRAPLQIAISSGGQAPVLARLWREKLEALIPQHSGRVASLAGQWRSKVKQSLSSLTERRRFWEGLFSGPFASLVERGQEKVAADYLEQALENHQSLNKGEVILVGAGPGDAGLLSLKALQAIQAADVVLYDALVSAQILDLVRRDADKVCVGKRAGAHQVIQERTNQLMIELARQGKRVVRLKGGDPFVFGRGGEEAQELVQAGIAYQVIPAVTAALGATAYAGIPLTHRDYAQTAMFITGHSRQEQDALEWPTLARAKQTLVIYMGSLKSAYIQEQLIAHGRAADTPVAIISNGTCAHQEVRIGQLKDLAQLAHEAPKPALMVIGEVVQLHQQLAWFTGSQSTHDLATSKSADNRLVKDLTLDLAAVDASAAEENKVPLSRAA